MSAIHKRRLMLKKERPTHWLPVRLLIKLNNQCTIYLENLFSFRKGVFYLFIAEKSVTASFASLTSWTLRMDAPFIKPIVFNTVVPFNASSTLMPSVL